MRIDYTELHAAARRQRAQAIAALLAAGVAWIASRVAHAPRPHFAR